MNPVTKECRLCAAMGPHQSIAVREMMFGTRERFEYYICAECDTLQIVEPLAGAELERHYGSGYYSYNVPAQPGFVQWLIMKQDRFQLHTGGRVIGALMAAVSTDRITETLGRLSLERDTRILDMGCGGGELLDRLVRAGFSNLSGADPFIAADGQTPLGVPLMKRYVSEVPGEFDLIMFNHSLEHVPNPIATLKAARQKLAPGGICLVRVPTTSSEAWAIYQADWVQIDAPRHMVIPSRKGLARAAEAAGLRVEQTIDDSSSFQFLGSEKYQRDIALTQFDGFKVFKLFGPQRIWAWERRAERLNRQGRGDQTAFVLRAQ